jgi:Na+-translocating ferredoxin:NAD+ oxidoreductase RnfD subunit
MHKPGESVTGIDTGTAQQWLHLLVVFGSIACAFVVVGALIGVILRRRSSLQVPIGIVLSILLYALLEWRFADPNEWSCHASITSAAYQIGPVVLFFIAPTLLGAAIVRRFCFRRDQSV